MKFSPSHKLNVFVLTISFLFVLLPCVTKAALGKLVIDEFRISGENSNDEYVVVANYGESAINLNNYRLVKRAKSATDYKLVDNFGDFVLAAGQRIVVSHTKFTGARDFTFLTGSSNTIADNNSIFLLAPDKSIVDLVGYGDAVYFEGSPTPAPGGGEVYARLGGLDTNNNSTDFTLQKPPPVIDLNANKLFISEILPSPEIGEEWFELYNPTSLDISLENLKICDAMGARHCFYFDSDEALTAGAYKSYPQSLTKITLNNTGDWLELYDISDNLITDSGGDFGAADKGISLAIFGTDYLWTKTLTPSSSNVFTDIIEIEADTPEPAPKTPKTKVSTVKKKATTTTAKSVPTAAQILLDEPVAEVKAASDDAETALGAVGGTIIRRQTLGWALIWLAILLVIGYILWYFRSYAKDTYNKIFRRDDSARF